jgi:hypothetical protein
MLACGRRVVCAWAGGWTGGIVRFVAVQAARPSSMSPATGSRSPVSSRSGGGGGGGSSSGGSGSGSAGEALAAIARGQAAERELPSSVSNLGQLSRGDGGDGDVAVQLNEHNFRCHLFRKLETVIWSMEAETEFHPIVNDVRGWRA